MKKRVILVFMAFTIAVSSFIGCSARPASKSIPDADSEKESKEGTVKLTVCLPDTQWGSSRDNELQKDVIKELEGKTNTKLNCIIPPQGSYKEKVNILVSSGDIPDVFRVFQAMVSLPGYAARGQIMPLDDYIKKSPVLSKIDGSLYDYINIDEKIYYLPKYVPLTKNI
jgi:putative aldouronate transport system substrate-binding protein